MLLTKEKIKKAKDVRKPLKFPIPEWKEKGDKTDPYCFLRHMSSSQRDEYDQALQVQGDLMPDKVTVKISMKGFRILLLSHTMVDDKDKLLFESFEEATEYLSERSTTAIERTWAETADINGISPKAVEEAEKN